MSGDDFIWRAYIGSGTGFLHAIRPSNMHDPLAVPVCGRRPVRGWKIGISRMRCSQCAKMLSVPSDAQGTRA